MPDARASWLAWVGVLLLHGLACWLLQASWRLTAPPDQRPAPRPPVWARLINQAEPARATAARPAPVVPAAQPDVAAATRRLTPRRPSDVPPPLQAPAPTDTPAVVHPDVPPGAPVLAPPIVPSGPPLPTASADAAAPASPVPAPAEATDVQAQVSYLKTVPPDYPRAARESAREGRVLLRVLVDEAGLCAAVDLAQSSGHADLDAAAIEAVRQWRFTPARLRGQTVQAYVLVPVRFALRP